MSNSPRLPVIGWDIGGAHVKACLLQRGQVEDVAQWPCPLWQGLQHLDAALAQAAARWPALAQAKHAVTMTGEMVDLFPHREEGVRRIAAHLAAALPGPVVFYAGEQGWCSPPEVAGAWEHIASANWLATARHVALWSQHTQASDTAGVLMDVGSTTTDLIAFRGGRVLSTSRSDAQRLASGELVYQGVVRTPLCALAQRIPLQGTVFNVMNEFFATTADVYRTTGELVPAHDQHPTADGAAKSEPATRQRLARMVGLDARDAADADWLEMARAWRAAQVAELGGQLRRVRDAHDLPSGALVVAAGCGGFLVPLVLGAAGWAPQARVVRYGAEVSPLASQAAAGVATWAQVCAPAVAVAVLSQQAEGGLA